MPAYLISLVDVTKPEQYAEYAKLAPIAHKKYGAKILARGGRAEAIEGEAPPNRVVVIEFESYEKAKAFYDSPEYQAARKHRVGAANFRMILVEGVAP